MQIFLSVYLTFFFFPPLSLSFYLTLSLSVTGGMRVRILCMRSFKVNFLRSLFNRQTTNICWLISAGDKLNNK